MILEMTQMLALHMTGITSNNIHVFSFQSVITVDIKSNEFGYFFQYHLFEIIGCKSYGSQI